jgi:hypothetical protein
VIGSVSMAVAGAAAESADDELGCAIVTTDEVEDVVNSTTANATCIRGCIGLM